jgi:hypothetical protein
MKRPLLCRIGLHRWSRVERAASVYRFVTRDSCSRCPRYRDTYMSAMNTDTVYGDLTDPCSYPPYR